MPKSNLSDLRTRIDEIDVQIQELITQRACLAEEIAHVKCLAEEGPVLYRPEREAAILHNIVVRNQGPLTNETLLLIFREIISACLSLQKSLDIAFLGPEGTYSQAAVLKHFGHSIHGIPLPTIFSVFREVEAGTAHYGVVPVENSTEGGVNQTLDCFITTSLKICGEIELPIHHYLLATTTDLAQVKRVYSHQQSLSQCRLWLDTYLPTAARVAVSSNAEAARLSKIETGSAAIAGSMAAEVYDLLTVAARIEEMVNNTTRFAVLGQQQVPPTQCDKTSLLLSSANRPGTLYRLLESFANNSVNMTRIESRPSRQGIWEYVYFIDIEGHIQDPTVAKAMEALQTHASFVKFLGSYPRAIL